MRFAAMHSSKAVSILLTLTLATTILCAQPQSAVNTTTTTLSGTVVDASGALIPHAILTLKGTNSLDVQIATDNRGHFAIEVAPKDYILVASAPGFAPSKKMVHLTSGMLAVESIRLEVGTCSPCVTVVQLQPLEVLNSSFDLLLPLSPLTPYKFPTKNTKHLHS
jgi:hypothetical protein